MSDFLPTFHQYAVNEGVSKLLYHFTNVHAIDQILQEDTFTCSGALATNADMWQNTQYPFYFSCQRSKNAKLGWGRYRSACLVLDGEKLQQRYRGKSADYWNYGKDKKDGQSASSFKDMSMGTELEDRLLVSKPTIPNALSYIQAIHVQVYPDDRNIQEELDRIATVCHDAGIRLFLYLEKRDYENQRTDKATSLADITFTAQRDPNADAATQEYAQREDEQIMRYTLGGLVFLLGLHNRHFADSGSARSAFKEYFGNEKWESFEKAEDYYYDLFHYYLDDSLERYFAALEPDFHNANKTMKGKLYRLIMLHLARQMKKLKCTSLKEFIWKRVGKPIYDDAPKLTPKGREFKPPFVWRVRAHGEERQWTDKLWNVVDVDDFWKALPREYSQRTEIDKKGSTRMYFVELINDEQATLKQAYNQCVKLLGRYKTHQLFSSLEVEVTKENLPKKSGY